MTIWPWWLSVALDRVYEAAEFLQAHEYKNVMRWAKEIGKRPAVKRGRMVTSMLGEPENQLRERHDASDFEHRTWDKVADKD